MSTTIRTAIIPVRPAFVGEKSSPNLEAICVFAATGFFLDLDSYYKNQQVLRPAHDYQLDDAQQSILRQSAYFHWEYRPQERSLGQVVKEFATLFEQIIDEQVGGRQVILPLSGGLDSRTQAAALKGLGKKVSTYSYSFQGGLDETRYGEQIAHVCDFPFSRWEVPAGYLWPNLQRLASLNECYSEFTHPRQMAFIDRYADLGEVFSLGHWGDVLFDSMRVADNMPFDDQVASVLQKIVKKGGYELAEALWKAWGMVGNFREYLAERVRVLLEQIQIEHSANSRIRAFKSLYWAPRWTAINLRVFESIHPISLPYFDNRMCEFICTVPERYLAARQIQIEYLKLRNHRLARIPWQEQRPFNLYTYRWNTMPFNLPVRILRKLKNALRDNVIQRNWELQFIGEANSLQLRHHLLDPAFNSWIPSELVERFYSKFKQDSVQYSHPVSMLLTLSQFYSQSRNSI